MLTAFKITASISILFLLITFQIPVSTLSSSKFNDHSSFFKDILNENPNFVNVKLSNMSILGSHDSFSNNINYFSNPNVNEKDNIVNNKFAMFFAKGLAVRYAKAQKENIYDQLKSGVRYIDARISNIDGVFYVTHGLISDKLENNLISILKFLDENPKEFIIFDVNDCFIGNSSKDDLEKYMRSIKYNNKSLFDYDLTIDKMIELKDLTYKDIVKDHAGAVIYSKKNYFEDTIFSNHVKNSIVYRTPTYGITSRGIIEDINKNAIECKQDNKKEKGLVINQIQLQTTYSRFLEVYWQWSLLNHAYSHNLNVVNCENLDAILDSMPIFLCDYSTSNQNKFNDLIIEKLHNRNIKLN